MFEVYVVISFVSIEFEEKVSLFDGVVIFIDGVVIFVDGIVIFVDGVVIFIDGLCEVQSRRFDGIFGSFVDGMFKFVGVYIGC